MDKKDWKIENQLTNCAEDYQNMNGMMNSIIDFVISFLFMTFLIIGGIYIISRGIYDSIIIGGFMLVGGIYSASKTRKAAQQIKGIYDSWKDSKQIIITIGNIGHFIYCLVPFTVIAMIISLCTKQNDFFIDDSYLYVIIIEAIIGTILYYWNKGLVVSNKNNIVINIKKNKEK